MSLQRPPGRVIQSQGNSLILLFVLSLLGIVPGKAQTIPLSPERTNHAASLLGSGMVLITGGVNLTATLDSALLYDPGSGTIVPTGTMTTPRADHTMARSSSPVATKGRSTCSESLLHGIVHLRFVMGAGAGETAGDEHVPVRQPHRREIRARDLGTGILPSNTALRPEKSEIIISEKRSGVPYSRRIARFQANRTAAGRARRTVRRERMTATRRSASDSRGKKAPDYRFGNCRQTTSAKAAMKPAAAIAMK